MRHAHGADAEGTRLFRSVTLIGNEDCAAYERPSLSKTVLLIDTEPTPIVTEDRLRSLDIAFLRNLHATRILPAAHEVECEDGRRVPYSKLLLATGALPRRIPQRADGVQYLRTWRDCQSLRATLATGTRLLVLGAGFLGLEVAAPARTRGAEVTVVESQPQILQRGVPPEIAAALRARHIRAGVAIQTGVVAVSTGSSSVRLGGGQQIETDCCLLKNMEGS